MDELVVAVGRRLGHEPSAHFVHPAGQDHDRVAQVQGRLDRGLRPRDAANPQGELADERDGQNVFVHGDADVRVGQERLEHAHAENVVRPPDVETAGFRRFRPGEEAVGRPGVTVPAPAKPVQSYLGAFFSGIYNFWYALAHYFAGIGRWIIGFFA